MQLSNGFRRGNRREDSMRLTGRGNSIRHDDPPKRARKTLLTAALVAAATAVSGTAIVAGSAQAAVSPAAAAAQLRSGHPYRHGVVPSLGVSARVYAGSLQTTSANNLRFGGGISGVGVTTGPERVYLVFWGSQWGTQSTNAQGYATFSGDPSGLAPDVQAFIAGLGTGGETWSGVMTQYCEGVSSGSQTCPSSASHVAYPPSSGALAGVWEDSASAAPSSATGHQLGAEAVNAATHFGNTSQASNRNTQYVVVSPTGTNPDGWRTNGFCAWHDYTGDTTLTGGSVSSPDGQLAFTNLPYVPDAGASCGAGFVNPGNNLDGVTIVEGHEYAETITDQYPAGGWTDTSGNENGDKCAWISSGQGASQNLPLTTGTFAVQSTWANDYNGGSGGCEVSHAIVSNGNSVTVTNPGNQTTTVGSAVSLQIHASDSASGQTLTYSASGLPTGLSINSASGLISGNASTVGTYTPSVTATDTTGAAGSTSFTWAVNSTSSSCSGTQLLGNPGFETGSAAPWSASPYVVSSNGSGETAHSGSWFAWLNGYGTPHTDMLSQTVTVGSSCHTDTFSFWLWIDTSESTTSAVDTLKVQVLSGSTVLATLATYSNLNANRQYVQHSFSLGKYAGKKITLKFTGTETDRGHGTTDFVIDDTALNQAT
jgi:serine protease